MCALLGFLLLPSIVTAHTHLEESNPQDGATITEELELIELVFDTAVQEQSQVHVLNEDNEPIPIAELMIEDDLISAYLEGALPNGTYTVGWDIIGADGHPTTGDFTFEINVAEEETAQEPATDSEEEEPPFNEAEVAAEPFTDPEEDVEPADGEVSEAEAENDGSGNGWIVTILVAVGIVVV